MARPPKWTKIDKEQLEKLAEKQWTIEQIAAFFRVSRDLIERRFAANIKEAKHRGSAKLKDLQWANALKGDTKMIIHMSKHHLDEFDKTRNEISTDGKPGFIVNIRDYADKK